MRLVFFILTLFVCTFTNSAVGQEFLDEPRVIFDESNKIAQEALSNPLILEGLNSIVFRYNSTRLEFQPAGYENAVWLGNRFLKVSQAVRSSASEYSEIDPLPDADLDEMIRAFKENSIEYYSFYNDIQGEVRFPGVSADEMLIYLSAYAVVANTIDAGLWKDLSSFTGGWPLCFWQG